MYYQRVNVISAFVLAGGKSKRMGVDKALLALGEKTLLDRALNLAKSVADQVFIAGDPGKYGDKHPVVEDIFRGRGPLGGIHAALVQTKTEFNLMLPVDTPHIQERFLQFLLAEARGHDEVVVVPRAGGYLHPLCAIYRREFAVIAEKALLRGDNKIDALFLEVSTRVIEEEEILGLGFQPTMFHNFNTPEDWFESPSSSPPEKIGIYSESKLNS